MTVQLPAKKTLTLEAARVALAAAEAEARRNEWRVVIAVVDDGGHAILTARLDGAQWSSIETALEKARAAVAWKRPTRLLEESVNGGGPGLLSIRPGTALPRGGGARQVHRALPGAGGGPRGEAARGGRAGRPG